jgi:ABC-type dipeptide/oligopeptide/nickel transport system permease component
VPFRARTLIRRPSLCATLFVLINLLVDLGYTYLDPRIRLA